MFDTPSLMLFIAASWVLILTPGPDTLYVLTRGIAQGKQAGVVSALGVTLGIFIHTLAAVVQLLYCRHNLPRSSRIRLSTEASELLCSV